MLSLFWKNQSTSIPTSVPSRPLKPLFIPTDYSHYHHYNDFQYVVLEFTTQSWNGVLDPTQHLIRSSALPQIRIFKDVTDAHKYCQDTADFYATREGNSFIVTKHMFEPPDREKLCEYEIKSVPNPPQTIIRLILSQIIPIPSSHIGDYSSSSSSSLLRTPSHQNNDS